MSLVLWYADHDDDLDDNDEDLDDNHDDDFDDVLWYDDHHHDFDEDANAGEGDFDGNGDEGKEQEIITNPPHQGHSCNIGNAPNFVGKKLKTVICVF